MFMVDDNIGDKSITKDTEIFRKASVFGNLLRFLH